MAAKLSSLPFPAIVEQDELKRVLLSVAANDALDGALIVGERGPRSRPPSAGWSICSPTTSRRGLSVRLRSGRPRLAVCIVSEPRSGRPAGRNPSRSARYPPARGDQGSGRRHALGQGRPGGRSRVRSGSSRSSQPRYSLRRRSQPARGPPRGRPSRCGSERRQHRRTRRGQRSHPAEFTWSVR